MSKEAYMQSSPMLSALAKIVRTIRNIRSETAIPILATQIRAGVGFQLTHPSAATSFAPAIFALIQEVPDLIEAGIGIIFDQSTEIVTRFGLSTALMYAAIPQNILVDTSGSGYGYIDEWLVLQASIYQYTKRPALTARSAEELKNISEFATQALPAVAIRAIQAIFAQLGSQSLVLPSIPGFQLENGLSEVLASAVPAFWSPGIGEAFDVNTVSSRGEWTLHDRGATWSNGRGAMYMRLPGGGSVAMNGNQLVAWPTT